MKVLVPLDVSKPSERELTVSRTFNAPRDLVFEAYTNPQMVKQWLFGPEEWRMVVCEIDFKVGGKFRFVWRHKEKGDMGMGGVYREIVKPKRIVHTELFDEDWTGGETLETTIFDEKDGRTTVTSTVRYASEAARDGALKTGMIDGLGTAYDRLAEFLVANA